MAFEFHEQQRALQTRFDTARIAERVQQGVHDSLSDEDRAFIEARDMFFMASVDAQGHASCSYKGGQPGFVRAVDERTIAFPSYDGNGMFMSMGNLAQTAEIGLLFIDFEGQTRMRFNGTASIDHDDPLLDAYPEAQLIVRVRAREIFINCPRYIHKMQLVERSQFVPHAGVETPSPAWKQMVKDGLGPETLPQDDPARAQGARFAER